MSYNDFIILAEIIPAPNYMWEDVVNNNISIDDFVSYTYFESNLWYILYKSQIDSTIYNNLDDDDDNDYEDYGDYEEN